MKNKTIVISSIVFLILGFAIGQIVRARVALAQDNDHDGIINSVDVDDDSDGILDETDTAPFDHDNDDQNDEIDVDDDSDEINDDVDNADFDQDNDGVADDDENEVEGVDD